MKSAKKLFLLFISIWTFSGCNSSMVQNKLLPSAINKQMDSRLKTLDILKDKEGIRVITVGTGTPFSLDRSMSGTAIIVNGNFFMFDVGPGVVAQIELQNLPITKINGVFLTHYHSDHYMDLPNLINRSWTQGKTEAMSIYGPEGLKDVVSGMNQFLEIENHYRVEHHGTKLLDIENSKAVAKEFQLNPDKKKIVFHKDGVKITAFKVNHDPVHSAVGYVIEYQGKKVVISGDTKKNALLEEMTKDADLLIHEVMLMSLMQKMKGIAKERGSSREVQIFQDIQDYHTSPTEVAEIAKNANVKHLVLSHMAPTPDNSVIKSMYNSQLKGFDGKITFAQDGNQFIIK